MESKKNDKIDGKLKYDLFPIESRAVEEMVKVYMAGEKKYGRNTWQGLKDGYHRYDGAQIRHDVEHKRGHIIDQETGAMHLAQVAWNALAKLECWLRENGEIEIVELKCPHCGETNYVENLRNKFNCWKCKKEIKL